MLRITKPPALWVYEEGEQVKRQTPRIEEELYQNCKSSLSIRSQTKRGTLKFDNTWMIDTTSAELMITTFAASNRRVFNRSAIHLAIRSTREKKAELLIFQSLPVHLDTAQWLWYVVDDADHVIHIIWKGTRTERDKGFILIYHLPRNTSKFSNHVHDRFTRFRSGLEKKATPALQSAEVPRKFPYIAQIRMPIKDLLAFIRRLETKVLWALCWSKFGRSWLTHIGLKCVSNKEGSRRLPKFGTENPN